MNACNAPVASSEKSSANSSTVMPAVEANVARLAVPFSTANCISRRVLDTALPPISASRPTADIAFAMPRTSSAVIPSILAVPPRREAIAAISDSVVGNLFPRSTIAEPILSKSSVLRLRRFARRARLSPASSAVIFVVSPSIIMTLVNSDIWSIGIPI